MRAFWNPKRPRLRRRAITTNTFDLDIPIIQGRGSESISKATFGKTLSGKITINHNLQRIDTQIGPVEEWTITLKLDDKEVTKRTGVKNGETITQDNIKTKFFGSTKFSVDVEFSLPWDLNAKIKLNISY